MIIVGSQRGGAKQLGLHLMNMQDNEHVTVHELRGFVSDSVVGAFKETQAIAAGTKCKQFLFSVSFNPPETESVDVGVFESAIERVEERNGLTDQPRVIVFHEKEGRRHAHAVWSRIDAETMTAKPLPFYKRKLNDVAKELYLEHDWQMPRGFLDKSERDPRNFTLEQWQQSKRCGYHARDLKGLIQECYAVSDSGPAFAAALEEKGFKLARGDRRGHVIVTHEGEVLSVARYTGKKAKEVREKLGDEQTLQSVADTKQQFANELQPVFESYLDQTERKAQKALAPLDRAKARMTQKHRSERETLDTKQHQRWEQETKERAARLNKGLKGLWDRLTGTREKTIRRNEHDAYAAHQRDKDQKQSLITAQLQQRQRLQSMIKTERAKAVKERHAIHKKLYDLRHGKLEPDKQAQRQPQPGTWKARAEAARSKTNTKSLQPPFNRAAKPQAPVPAQNIPAAPKPDAWKNRPELRVTVQGKPALPKERLDQLRQDIRKVQNQRVEKMRSGLPQSAKDRLEALRQQRARPASSRTGPTLER